MSTNSTDQMSNSLRGRIWLAVGALAVLNCILGLIAYLAASFFTSNTFFIVFAAFAVTSVCTVIFGRWMSGEILRPIEKVSLLAKSLERGSAVSLPKTTGASETDELLQTLHRSSRQLQNLIGMMDSVSSGNTETALKPIENADRLSASFQKLVSKVTDSVDAGHELAELQTALRQLTSDLSMIRNGNLNAEIRGDFAATKEISDAVRMLVSGQTELVRHIQANSAEADRSALEAKKLVRLAIDNDDRRARKLNRAAEAFKQNPLRIDELSAQISSALSSLDKSVDAFETGKQSSREGIDSINALRKEINAVSQKLQRIDGHSLAITQVSKLADDLARRANLIALNASIQAGSGNGGSAALIAGEISSLSERAAHVNKEVTAINESINSEIEQARQSVKSLTASITGLSAIAAKGDDAIGRLSPFFDGLTQFPAKIEAGKSGISSDSRQMLSALDECSSDAANSEANLKDCEEIIGNFTVPLDNLRDSISRFRTSHKVEVAEIDLPTDEDFRTQDDNIQNAESFELTVEN